tara:strand:- start:926 stop:1102 length:177 start_codon:yes stop_codon:yes gene_type:complete
MEYLNIITLIDFSLTSIPAYIDPGSASAFMAMIIGAIAGAGMTLKLYWFKIKEKFSKN